MPLGVFALTHEESGDPIMFVQLAVAKDGTISGTYFNSVTDSAETVQGAVDKETQRAAWTIGSNANTVMETGVYNLTQEESTVLVHFGKDRTQTWLMVRVNDTDESGNPITVEEAAAAAAEAAAAPADPAGPTDGTDQ